MKNAQFTLSLHVGIPGCITVFHRGGSKQLQQRIDLKQSSVGIVELINYDISIYETTFQKKIYETQIGVFFCASRD